MTPLFEIHFGLLHSSGDASLSNIFSSRTNIIGHNQMQQ